MNFSAISLLLFFLLPFVSAANLEITSPSEVVLNENFSVTLISDIIDLSDVKIYIQNSEAKIFSEIFNSGWKNSFYYLLSTFPEKTEYILRAVKSSGNFEICAKLRKFGKTSIASSKCNSIIVKTPQNSSENKPLEIINKTITPEESKEHESAKDSQESKINTLSNHFSPNLPANSATTSKEESPKEYTQNQQNSLIFQNERITLNSFQKPTISEYTTRQEKLRLTFIYLFPLLVILILILVIFNKI